MKSPQLPIYKAIYNGYNSICNWKGAHLAGSFCLFLLCHFFTDWEHVFLETWVYEEIPFHILGFVFLKVIFYGMGSHGMKTTIKRTTIWESIVFGSLFPSASWPSKSKGGHEQMGMMLQVSKWLGSPPFKSHELVIPCIFASYIGHLEGALWGQQRSPWLLSWQSKGTPPNAPPPQEIRP